MLFKERLNTLIFLLHYRFLHFRSDFTSNAHCYLTAYVNNKAPNFGRETRQLAGASGIEIYVKAGKNFGVWRIFVFCSKA